jgi:cytochrome c-type biogenesis protein CcmF
VVLIARVSIYAALLLSAVAAGIAFWSSRDESRADWASNAHRLTVIIFGAVTLSSAVLMAAFILKDYSLTYVAGNSSPDMNVFFRMAAFWAGQEGSLLLWAWFLTGFSALIAWRTVSDAEPLVTVALGILNLIGMFFLIVLATPSGDPFKTVTVAAEAVGRGINPLLLHWAMIAHPPTLFVGYAGLAVPFAFALSALILGDTSRRWLQLSDRYAVAAWLFLTIGIFLGALWAYVVLGWGGFWGWDPVENSSFLPWLAGTAMLHSFTVWKRREGFKRWAVGLASASFFLTLLATYITRSGIIQSAHTFEGDPVFKFLFEVFMWIVVLATVALLIYRRHELSQEGEPEDQLMAGSFLSKDFVYYLNNVILTVVTLVVTYATLAPAITRWLVAALPALAQAIRLTGEISYKPEFYNSLAAPISTVYVALMAICPLLAWRRTDREKFGRLLLWPAAATAVGAVPILLFFGSNAMGATGMIFAVLAAATAIQMFVRGALNRAKSKQESIPAALGGLFLRNRVQTGGYLVHLGIALTLIGVIGTNMYGISSDASTTTKKGATFQASGISFKVLDFKETTYPRLDVAPSTYVLSEQKVTLAMSQRGIDLGTITPISRVYQSNADSGQGPSPKVDIRHELFRDVFVILQQAQSGTLFLTVKVNPLISLVWFGSIVLVLGTAWAAWPQRRTGRV